MQNEFDQKYERTQRLIVMMMMMMRMMMMMNCFCSMVD